jgi:very-short-patch-repair endonuclease
MKLENNQWKTTPELWEKLKSLAREKRSKPTEAENILWQHLRRHQIRGLSFRRQHCLGPFIVDFYCKKAMLIIEIDGPIHQYKPEEDKIRQEYLESLELTVLRFPNDIVLSSVDEIIRQIGLRLQP